MGKRLRFSMKFRPKSTYNFTSPKILGQLDRMKKEGFKKQDDAAAQLKKMLTIIAIFLSFCNKIRSKIKFFERISKTIRTRPAPPGSGSPGVPGATSLDQSAGTGTELFFSYYEPHSYSVKRIQINNFFSTMMFSFFQCENRYGPARTIRYRQFRFGSPSSPTCFRRTSSKKNREQNVKSSIQIHV